MIDVHVHVVNNHVHGDKPLPGHDESILDRPTEELAARVRDQMKAAGITTIFGMGRLSPPSDDPLGVAGTLRLAALIPGLKPIGVADPNHTDAGHLKRVEEQLATGKIVALKAYLGYLHHGPDSPGYVPYYRLAAKFDIPFFFHTGDTWATKAKVKYAHPLLVDEVAVNHPKVKFILAHLGNPWLIDAAEVVFKNENVWADLSGLLVGDDNALKLQPDGTITPNTYLADVAHDIRKAFRYTEKPDRFLYGSDWPLTRMASYRKFIEAVVPKEHHEAVFYLNAKKLFKLQM